MSSLMKDLSRFLTTFDFQFKQLEDLKFSTQSLYSREGEGRGLKCLLRSALPMQPAKRGARSGALIPMDHAWGPVTAGGKS